MIDVCMLRKGMIAEEDTIVQYKKMMDQCETAEAKKLFEDIIWEEARHSAEFRYLIEKMCPRSAEEYRKGEQEAAELLADQPLISSLND